MDQIRASVIDLAAKCRQLRQFRQQLRDRLRAGERDAFIVWDDGTRVGFEAMVAKKLKRRTCSRHHQLAYAFVRGRRYRQVERRNRAEHPASSYIVTECLLEAFRDRSIVPAPELEYGGKIFTHFQKLITEWLEEPAEEKPVNVEQAA